MANIRFTAFCFVLLSKNQYVNKGNHFSDTKIQVFKIILALQRNVGVKKKKVWGDLGKNEMKIALIHRNKKKFSTPNKESRKL